MIERGNLCLILPNQWFKAPIFILWKFLSKLWKTSTRPFTKMIPGSRQDNDVRANVEYL